jgi:hypothetical protein
MRTSWRNAIRLKEVQAWVVVAGLFMTAPAFAKGNSAWENAVDVLQLAFTSPIVRGLSLVAGLTFAFGEGGSKRILAGVLFGVGMAIAVNFLSWLFLLQIVQGELPAPTIDLADSSGEQLG